MSRISRQLPTSASPRTPAKPEASAGQFGAGARARSSDELALGGTQTPKALRDFSPFFEDQKETNGCGTTSLAMLLSAWLDQPGAYTRQSIDRRIRGFDLPTSPQNIVSYARSQGFRAVAQNNAQVDDLKKYVDQGVPVQVLYDPDGNGADSLLHYVVVIDYEQDAKGNVTSLKIADPSGGLHNTVPLDEFKRRWDKLQIRNKDTGINNLMIPMIPKADVSISGKDGVTRSSRDIQLPAGGNLGWRMGLADKLLDLGNGVDKLQRGAADLANKLKKVLSSL